MKTIRPLAPAERRIIMEGAVAAARVHGCSCDPLDVLIHDSRTIRRSGGLARIQVLGHEPDCVLADKRLTIDTHTGAVSWGPIPKGGRR